MPKLSKATAPHTDENPALVSHHGPVGDYTVVFESYRVDADGAPFFRGLPDDRCQSPHWGYVISGALTLRYADHDETYEAGDAYYAPPGHVPVVTAGTADGGVRPREAARATMESVGRSGAPPTASRP